MMKETKSQPTRLQWLWLHLGLLHRMLRLAAEGLVVAVLVLAGLVQSLRLISWWDRGIEVEHLRGEQETYCSGQNQWKGQKLIMS